MSDLHAHGILVTKTGGAFDWRYTPPEHGADDPNVVLPDLRRTLENEGELGSLAQDDDGKMVFVPGANIDHIVFTFGRKEEQ